MQANTVLNMAHFLHLDKVNNGTADLSITVLSFPCRPLLIAKNVPTIQPQIMMSPQIILAFWLNVHAHV